MSRLHTMSRFDESIPEERICGECEDCGTEFYAGEEVVLWEGFHFCDKYCLLNFIDYELTIVE